MVHGTETWCLVLTRPNRLFKAKRNERTNYIEVEVIAGELGPLALAALRTLAGAERV